MIMLPYPFLTAIPRTVRGGTTQRVQDLLRAAIIRLDFKPGEVIDKQAVCDRLGVSRFPVSEALGRLAEEGFVDILPQRATRVSRIDIEACRQGTFIRCALEGQAVKALTERGDAAMLERLRANMQLQQTAVEQSDYVQFFELDRVFHDILLSELGYSRVKTAVESARGTHDRIRLFMLRQPEPRARSFAEHQDIVGAIAAHEPQRAHDSMMAHIERANAEIEALADKFPELFSTQTDEVDELQQRAGA
jgi:GntR family transcriptional regulator, rspAB operon transcriptional repressor